MKIRTVIAVAAVVLLAGCSSFSGGNKPVPGPGESNNGASADSSHFEAKKVDPVTAPKKPTVVSDPGLNIDVRFRGVRPRSKGGSIIHVAIKNKNDVPLPPDALGQPTLKVIDSNGKKIDIDPISGNDNIPLDLPLGVGATTNLQWAFDTGNYSLSDAEFQIGNVIFSGKLKDFV